MPPQSLLDDAREKFGDVDTESTDCVLRWDGKCLYVEHKIERGEDLIYLKKVDVTADVAAYLAKTAAK